MSDADLNAALQHAREDLATMARELVNLQDRLEVQDAELHEAKHRLAQYDSDSLALSKQLAADNVALREMLNKLRQAHPLSCCADEQCGVCKVLFPPLAVVKS